MSVSVDTAFIQAPEHRPSPIIAVADSIPLIDLSPLVLHYDKIPADGPVDVAALPPALQQLVADVEAACQEWGFFQVINHGVPSEVMEKAWAASRAFFELPMDEKKRIRRDEVNPLGYYEAEHTRNVRDWKEVFDFVLKDKVKLPVLAADAQIIGGDDVEFVEIENRWPEVPADFRETILEYAKSTEGLGYKLLELIALTLNLPAKRLNGYFTMDNTHFVRLNYYPPCPAPHLALGVGRHKDAGALTILAQDSVAGLDVKRKSDGQWVRVKPIPNSYIINVGDAIQVWSNDKYESAEHRVTLNTEKERFSVPFFFNPGHDVNIKPLEELLDDDSSANYEEYNWGEFFMTRKNSNFKKLNEENLQITQFKKE